MFWKWFMMQLHTAPTSTERWNKATADLYVIGYMRFGLGLYEEI